MAQLKDTVVSGSLRATDSLLTTTLQTKILKVPDATNSTTYGVGTNGQVILSNGTSAYWGAVVNSVKISTTSPVSGNMSAAATGAVTCTIALADGYGDTKNPYGNKNKNLVLATHATDNSKQPTFRALVSDDIPTATTSIKGGMIVGTGLGVSSGTVSVTYGTAAGAALASSGSAGSANSASRSDHTHPFPALTSCTGTLTIAKGGTGLSQADPHKVLIGPNSGTNAAAPTWRKPLVADLEVYTGSQTNQVTSSPYQSALWKFNLSRSATSFTTGDIILIKTPGGGGSQGVFLSLDNGTTYRPVCISGTSRLTTHFTSGVLIVLTYDSAGQANGIYGKVDANGTLSTTTSSNNVSGGCWRIMNLYDSGNSNDTGTLVRDYGGNVPIVTTTAALYRYKILLSLTDTNYGWKVVPANTTNATDLTQTAQNTGKTTIYTGDFNPFGDIYYYNSTTTINANATVRADAVWKTYPADIRYSFNCSNTLTASKDVYLVAYLTGPCAAKLRNPGATAANAAATATGANAGPITQTLPTTADGFIYIRLGRAYNTTTVDLAIDHPIYYHDGVAIRLLSQSASYGATLPANGREGQVFYQLSDPWYEIPPGGSVGDVLMKHSGADRDVYWSTPSGVGGYRPDTTVKYYVAGSTVTTANTNPGVFNTNVYVENNVLFGAAWNDYAEYRQCLLPPEPGRCIVENGDGTLSLSSKRLQPGAEIVSDTFGFAIGQNKKCNTPIAVSGRVLAYMDVPRDQIKIGAPVCSGPNGTISQMTEQEARDYPWLIIGTVSQIPVEAEWGENKVRVNGRVWIRVR